MLAPIAVAEVMRTPVETIQPERSAREAARRLADLGIGSLVVCEHGAPVGILTDVDLTELLAEGRDPEATTVEAIMGQPLITVEATSPIEDAAALLREHTVKRLPVVEDGHVVGIVTTTDLAAFLPHLVRRGQAAGLPEHAPEPARVRPDTLYEREDWRFEYLGSEANIEVGDCVRFSKTLTDEDVQAFAEASGDTNRLHLDESFAAETRFGERIAHGTLVVGVISAALARLPGLIVYLSQDVSYLGPVPLGERVTAECTVVEDIGNGRYRLSTAATVGGAGAEAATDAEPEAAASGEAAETVVDGEAVVLADEI
jgi:acyl dehydratase/CBS domain-containing protein